MISDSVELCETEVGFLHIKLIGTNVWFPKIGILAVKFIIGLDLAVTRPSPESCWNLFAIAAEQSVELKWLILNKHKRWFHSSRVKFPFVSMSASWFLVSVYLIWILESRLILSNNQSKATRWLQDTCLIVGRLPLMIILITASLSSKMQSIALNWEDFAVDVTKSTLLDSKLSCWVGVLVWLWVCLFDGVSRNRFPVLFFWISLHGKAKNGTLH